jgi:HK97 family phage prohead protease
MRTKTFFAFEVKAKASGTFEGYASVFNNEDLGGDVIVPGAFTKTIKERQDFPILWSHSYCDPPIGVNQKAAEDAKGLYVEGQLAMEVQRAKEVFSLMQVGAIKGLSIGYDPLIVDYSEADAGRRILRELKLWEYSPTTFPMNPEAQVTGVKSNNANLDATLDQLIAFASRDLGEIPEDRKAKIAKALEKLSALQAAKAPGAAPLYDAAPDIHAALDRLRSIL